MTSAKDIDDWTGALSTILIRSANRNITDDEIKQVIGIVGGLAATALQDLHRMADALAVIAKAQQQMANPMTPGPLFPNDGD